MNNAVLFSDEKRTCFAARKKEILVETAKAPLIMTALCFQVVGLCVVGAVEWEIIYRVFDYLSGDEGYWSAEILGLSSAVIVVGFHILSITQPRNIAVRFVNGAVGILIPLYMVGVGLLVVSIIDVGSLIQTDLPIPRPGEIPLPIDASWSEWVFSDVVTPLAALLFSFGLGALVIINVFVAHYLITRIIANLHEVHGRLSAAKQAIADHRTIIRCQKDYAALQQERHILEKRRDSDIRLTITTEVLSLIAGALWPHKQWLSKQAVNGTSDFAPASPTNAKHIAKAVAQIEAIGQADILHHIHPHNLEDTP